MRQIPPFLLALFVAIGLTVVFWWPLWQGGGFVGGDIYPYFLPQKACYADHLARGEFPLWNNLTGHGYPIVGESQTGAFYPFNLLLYPTLELNTAYNVNHLLHYVLAFMFTWLYARRIGLTYTASVLAATVYVYGWFPVRCSLEWAILGGTWLPLAVWCVESFLQQHRWRYLLGLTLTLAVQMLAGHFSLAFVTQLVVAAYAVVRLSLPRIGGITIAPGTRRRTAARLAAGFALAFPLAAIQLMPTWELKQLSQRATVSAEHDPGFGHIPPVYWSQLIASWWFWYSPEINLDHALDDMRGLRILSRTNRVEAHLYFGSIPLLLACYAMIRRRRMSDDVKRLRWMWGLTGVVSLIYTSGWLVTLTRHLPGFSFFEGPGRYGAATTFSAALLAAMMYDTLSFRRRWQCVAIAILIITLTVVEFRFVARRVAVAEMVNEPPIAFLNHSTVRRTLAAVTSTGGRQPDPTVRLLAPGENLPTLLGVAATPQYLGIGPAAYYDPDLTIPQSPERSDDDEFRPMSEEQFAWMRRAGVTHLLSFTPIDEDRWPVELLLAAPDRFLNAAWGRRRFERLFCYRVLSSPGRVRFVGNAAGCSARLVSVSANHVTLDASTENGGRLVLADLAFPGWKVSVNGESAESLVVDGMFRAVDIGPGASTVNWKYQPASVLWGALISLLTVVTIAAVAHRRLRHRPTLPAG